MSSIPNDTVVTMQTFEPRQRNYNPNYWGSPKGVPGVYAPSTPGGKPYYYPGTRPRKAPPYKYPGKKFRTANPRPIPRPAPAVPFNPGKPGGSGGFGKMPRYGGGLRSFPIVPSFGGSLARKLLLGAARKAIPGVGWASGLLDLWLFFNPFMPPGLPSGPAGNIRGSYNMDGWVLQCATGPYPVTRFASAAAPSVLCDTGFFTVSTGIIGEPIPVNSRYLAFGQFNGIRQTRSEVWFGPMPVVTPRFRPAGFPDPFAPPYPMESGDAPWTDPIPVALIPKIKTLPGYGGVGGGFGPPPLLWPRPLPPPSHRPTVPVKGKPQPPHIVRPPRGTEKEKKKALSPGGWQQWIRRGIDATSEFNDAVSAVHGALPASLRRGDKTLQAKLGTLYKNADKINMAQAIKNLMAEQAQDAAFGTLGRINKAAIKANPYWNSPLGFQAGGRYRPFVPKEYF